MFAFKDRSDRWYTNGLRLSKTYLTKDVAKNYPEFRAPLGFLTEWWCGGKCTARGWSFGQNMYTPADITVASPQPGDRPWGAWLYVGATAQKHENEDRRLRTLEVDLGLIGPLAMGKFVQTEWHKLVGARTPRGWDNQLRNEPGVAINYDVKHRIGGDSFDIVPHYGFNVGNIYTNGYAGMTLRLGQGISGFGVPLIRPSSVVSIQKQRNGGSERPLLSEWFVFAMAEARLVGWNAFLDGNAFRDGPSVSKKSFVSDGGFGVSARFRNDLRLSYMRIVRGPEFNAPPGIQRTSQTFGALVVTKEFSLD